MARNEKAFLAFAFSICVASAADGLRQDAPTLTAAPGYAAGFPAAAARQTGSLDTGRLRGKQVRLTLRTGHIYEGKVMAVDQTSISVRVVRRNGEPEEPPRIVRFPTQGVAYVDGSRKRIRAPRLLVLAVPGGAFWEARPRPGR